MNNDFKEIIAFLSQYLVQECVSCNQSLLPIHTIINVLVQANIPFNLSMSEGTRSSAKSFTLTITLSPTLSLQKTYALQEGTVSSDNP